jgi:hypothetical protein
MKSCLGVGCNRPPVSKRRLPRTAVSIARRVASLCFFLSSHRIAMIGKTAPERTLTYPVGSHGQLGMHYKKRSD